MTIDRDEFINRRNFLTTNLKRNNNSKSGGTVLLLGNTLPSRNFERNYYPFRQDSHFLYYTGLDIPDLALLIYPDAKSVLVLPAADESEIIWSGEQSSPNDLVNKCGADSFIFFKELSTIATDLFSKKELYYLTPFKGDNLIKLASVLNLTKNIKEVIKLNESSLLAREIVEQRSIKSADEVVEIERSLNVSALMYQRAVDVIHEGITESFVAGVMQGAALELNCQQSFLPIVTVRGEILHNNTYNNRLKDGDLLLIDSGVEAPPLFYSSDITRTYSISQKMSDRQQHIYDTVLQAQLDVINKASPKVSNTELHLIAAKKIVEGLKTADLMKGNIEEAVNAGAHALFFPHGIGHMLGLDVHDMEDLGDIAGYPGEKRRSGQFGLSFLRLVKKLRPGFVITVEPGIYFIPALFNKWNHEKKHENFINYNETRKYLDFGGIRIEDDVLITQDGCRVLSSRIPK